MMLYDINICTKIVGTDIQSPFLLHLDHGLPLFNGHGNEHSPMSKCCSYVVDGITSSYRNWCTSMPTKNVMECHGHAKKNATTQKKRIHKIPQKLCPKRHLEQEIPGKSLVLFSFLSLHQSPRLVTSGSPRCDDDHAVTTWSSLDLEKHFLYSGFFDMSKDVCEVSRI